MFSEQDSEPNETRGEWLREAFAKAAAEANADPLGEPVFGWRERTLSSRVSTTDGVRWLRLVSEDRRWAGGEFWTGNTDASVIAGVAKPSVLHYWEWEQSQYRFRAELMTLVPGRHCSSTPELREPLPLPEPWWDQLHGSLDALAATSTARTHVWQADIAHRLRVFFGDRVTDPTVSHWSCAHTDLHWANLMAPDCILVDWEGWGIAPSGFDAATLYLHSLLQPEMAERVHAEFADMLTAQDGLLAQLFVTGRMLLRINTGDYPDLAIPLHHNAERVIAMLTRPR